MLHTCCMQLQMYVCKSFFYTYFVQDFAYPGNESKTAKPFTLLPLLVMKGLLMILRLRSRSWII